MPEKIFFQCSLPRVGSTIFQNLINQNPDFYASANNGLINLVHTVMQKSAEVVELKVIDDKLVKDALSGFYKGSMHGFYNAITDKRFVLDKSRGNFANYEFVSGFYPNPKVICLVRNICDVFASMEKLFRKNQYKSNVMVNHSRMQGTTTFKRVLLWHNSYAPMLKAFANSIISGADKQMLFIKYESLCNNPEYELQRFYSYIGVPAFHHHLSDIDRTIFENEVEYEYDGLFNLRKELSKAPSDANSILGQDICDWLNTTYKQYNRYFEYSSESE